MGEINRQPVDGVQPPPAEADSDKSAGADAGATEHTGQRIIDLAEQPVYVSLKDRLLVLDPKGGQRVTVELAEVAAVLAAHQGVTFTRGALAGLAEAGAIVVVCDQRCMPVGMFMPLGNFHAPGRRMAAQAEAGRPLCKQLWKTVVQAKVRAQAALLARRGCKYLDVLRLAAECKSGDTTNVEAQASRLYWQRLFGPNFRRVYDRSTDPTDENRYLNYGYGVLRAIVCRAICGAGLHPGLGIHHHHRNNPFPLADDLMEPFRPLVDERTVAIRDAVGGTMPVNADLKERLLQVLQARVILDGEKRGLFDAAARVAGRLGEVFEKGAGRIDWPVLWQSEKAMPSAQLDAPACPSDELPRELG